VQCFGVSQLHLALEYLFDTSITDESKHASLEKCQSNSSVILGDDIESVEYAMRSEFYNAHQP